MEIFWKESIPGPKDYFKLFRTTGWNKLYGFNIDELYWAIDNSWYVLSVYHLEKLIGFGRIISDGIHHALLVDIIVHPDYQNKGIGGELVEKLLKHCKRFKIRDIQLFSTEGKAQFYKNYGFEPRPENAPGMQFLGNPDK